MVLLLLMQIFKVRADVAGERWRGTTSVHPSARWLCQRHS